MEKVSRSNLINLALVYNYLVNKKDKISVNVINKYIEVINMYLKRDNKDKISENNNIKNNSVYNYVIYDNEKYIQLNKNLVLENLYHDTVHSLEDYLLNISLYEGVLDVLNIKREDLPIDNYYERKQENIDIIMTVKKEIAENVARKHLEMKGMKNVQINVSRLNHFDDDIGYTVSTTYDLLCEYLDISKFSEYAGSFQKRLIYDDKK